jgi:hypothetical protein
MAPQCWQEGFGFTTIVQGPRRSERSEDDNDDDHCETHRSDNANDP